MGAGPDTGYHTADSYLYYFFIYCRFLHHLPRIISGECTDGYWVPYSIYLYYFFIYCEFLLHLPRIISGECTDGYWVWYWVPYSMSSPIFNSSSLREIKYICRVLVWYRFSIFSLNKIGQFSPCSCETSRSEIWTTSSSFVRNFRTPWWSLLMILLVGMASEYKYQLSKDDILFVVVSEKITLLFVMLFALFQLSNFSVQKQIF